MKTQINNKIKDLGLELAGGGASGCFYFVDVASNTALNADSVMVSAMKHLSMNQWREEAEFAFNANREREAQNLKDWNASFGVGVDLPSKIILRKAVY